MQMVNQIGEYLQSHSLKHTKASLVLQSLPERPFQTFAFIGKLTDPRSAVTGLLTDPRSAVTGLLTDPRSAVTGSLTDPRSAVTGS